MKRLIILPVLSLLLLACSSNRVAPQLPSTYSGEPKFEAVAVRVWGFEDSQPHFMVRNYFPQIKDKILTSGLFRDGQNPSYLLDIKWDYENEHPTRAVVSGIVRAFTLFVVPDKEPMIHTMHIDVYRGRQLIKAYRYEEKVEYWSSAFTDNELVGAKWFHLGVNKILERFFNDLGSDGILTMHAKRTESRIVGNTPESPNSALQPTRFARG